jgi:chromosomal replication initiation ATPase DnaA
VTAAIYEAVESGSAFVAPRRLREILGRWTREGAPDTLRVASEMVPVKDAARAASITDLLGDAPEFPLPHGFGSRRTWAFAVERATGVLSPDVAAGLFRGTGLVRYHEGEATIAVSDQRQADQLSGGYRGVIERALSEAMRRPVRIAVIAPDEQQEADVPVIAPVQIAVEHDRERGRHDGSGDPPAIFEVAGSGMTSEQVWAAALDELAASGEIPAANLAAWIRPARLIAERPGGVLVIGAPHAPARRRIASHFVLPIEAALSRVLGQDVRIEVVVGVDAAPAEATPTPRFFMPGGEQAGG